MNNVLLNIVVYTGGICCSVLMVLLTICSCAMIIERLKKKRDSTVDKQKQIEEMVSHITTKCENCVCGCEDCEFGTESKAYCRSRCHAAELCNAGYRKVTEGKS